MIKLDPDLLSSASSSSESHKRAGSTDSDEYSFRCKKSRSVSLVMEERDLEPYVRRRRSSNEKAKNRLMKMDPEEQDRLRQCINSRERKRMHNLNSALDQLRNSLPNSKNPAFKKLSKINTIVTASDWIVTLTKENIALREKLSDLGTSIPAPQITFSTSSNQQHPSPPFISFSPKRSEEGMKPPPKKKASITPKATAAAKQIGAPPPLPPPPLDPAPQINAAAFLSNFPHFFPNFLHHQAAAAAAAAAAVSGGTTFLPQRLGGTPSTLTLSMPSPQIPGFCLKDCHNNGGGGGVCLCVKCLLSNKNTVS